MVNMSFPYSLEFGGSGAPLISPPRRHVLGLSKSVNILRVHGRLAMGPLPCASRHRLVPNKKNLKPEKFNTEIIKRESTNISLRLV